MLSRSGRRNAPGRRFARVPTAGETWLLAEAALTLTAVHIARRLLPTSRVQALLRRVGPRRRPTALTARAGWAVDVASRALPDGACLSRALTTQALLERRGCRARLAIDFRREPDGRLAGHAGIALPEDVSGASADPQARETTARGARASGGAA
jgi:hypothetical protein